MSAVSIDKFFKIFTFLRDNPYTTVAKNFQQEADFIDVSYNLFNKVLKFDSVNSLSLTKDVNIVNTALQARQKTRKFIIRTMIPGSYAFNTKDMDLVRTLFVDWASTVRTQKDMMMQTSDAYSLDDEDIDKAIKGFGITWCNVKSRPKLVKEQRAKFLYAICDLYKIKGSPISITRALQYMGISNAIIREHWIEKVPPYDDQLQIRAVATSKHIQEFNPDKNRYDYFYKGSADDVIIPWDSFMSKVQEIADPHWWYKHDEIVDLDNDPNTYLKLQSLTPYFGVISYNDLNKYNLAISFMEKMLTEQFNQFLTGDKDFLPQDIGLDGFNQELTQRKLQIDGFNDPLTLIEVYLAWCYCNIRNDEYRAYTKLKDFITSHQVNIPASQLDDDDIDDKGNKNPLLTYKYPYAYQELINRLYHYGDKSISDGSPVTLDIILQQYPGDLSHYYLSNNELIYWWTNVMGGTPETLPEIFTSSKYRFQYKNDITNTEWDKILHYNGKRSLDYRNSDFQYNEALNDFAVNSMQILNRGTVYNSSKSYFANNYKTTTTNQLSHYIYDHTATYYKNISWYADNFKEDIEHDGSYLTPKYIGKWPETKSWNWAIDNYFYYLSYTPYDWCRWSVERKWDSSELAYVDPDSKDIFGKGSVGHTFYQNQYVYAYVSENTWVRWVVETNWGYCDGPITPDGGFRVDNDFSRQFIVGSISRQTAIKYLNGRLEEGIDRVGLTVDPYEVKGTKKILTLSINEFEQYIKTVDAHVDLNGNIIKNVDYIKHDQYIYSYVSDISTGYMRWVRKPCTTNWREGYNGKKTYHGLYHYAGLDLNNRYNAERILKGQYVVSLNELLDLGLGTIIQYCDLNKSNRILVCQSDNGYPAIYKIPAWEGNWVGQWNSEKVNYKVGDITYSGEGILYKCIKNTVKDIELTDTTYWQVVEYDINNLWVKCPADELSKANLGFNQKLLNWIDNVRCTEEASYGELADELLAIFSNYMSIQFQDEELNIAGIYKDIGNNGLYHDAINFYKPKRARLLYFSVEFSIDTRFDNSLYLEDVPETTKIIHEIQDHVPHNDLIYLNTKRYHQDNRLVSNETILDGIRVSITTEEELQPGPITIIQGNKKVSTHCVLVDGTPTIKTFIDYGFTNGSVIIKQEENSFEGSCSIEPLYTETNPAKELGDYYICDCPLEYVNGFYKKIIVNNQEFWVNDHNVVIQRVFNPSPIWTNQYASEWIIARRSITGYSRCDALYINYIDRDIGNEIDPSCGRWIEPKQDPIYVDEPAIILHKISNIPDVLRPQDRYQTITPIVEDVIGEVSWEETTDKPRENIQRFTETYDFHQSRSHVDPAYCTDQIRPLWPRVATHNKFAGVPDSIQGGKLEPLSENNFKQSDVEDNYNTEYRNSFRDPYPYRDHLVITDGCDNTCENPGPRRDPPDNTPANNYFMAKSRFNGMDMMPGHFVIAKGDGKTSVFNCLELETLQNTSADYDVYINGQDTPLDSSDYNINGTTITFNFIPQEDCYITAVKYSRPEWYINNPTMFYQGPNHRPVYMGINNGEHDMLPCHDWSDCCDYYDIGCRHDGPTNPHIEIWQPQQNDEPAQWIPCETAEGNVIDFDLDEWTRYHKEVGYIGENQTALYNRYYMEKIRGRVLENPGDTYCNECGHPAISPDLETNDIPAYLRQSGIYHKTLYHKSKIKSNKYFENVKYWTSLVNDEPYEVKVERNEKNNFFKYGYVSDNKSYQIRHAYNVDTATHIWQVTNTTEPIKVLYQTKFRNTQHDYSEIDGKLPDYVSSPKNFLEETECDVAEDTFLDADGNETSLIFTNDTFIRVTISSNLGGVNLGFPETFWITKFIKQSGNDYGYVYIYTPEGWKKINHKAYVTDKPKDETNYFGYWLTKNSNNKYNLYLLCDGYHTHGWVVIRDISSLRSGLNDYTDVYSDDWVINGNYLYKLSHMAIDDSTFEMSSDTHVCADPIAYRETFNSMFQQTKGRRRNTCTIREKIFTNIYNYVIKKDILLQPEEASSSSAQDEEDQTKSHYRRVATYYGSNPMAWNFIYLKNMLDDQSQLDDYNASHSTSWKFEDNMIYHILEDGLTKIKPDQSLPHFPTDEYRYTNEGAANYVDEMFPEVEWVIDNIDNEGQYCNITPDEVDSLIEYE